MAQASHRSETSAMPPPGFLKLIWAMVVGQFIFNEISNLRVYFGALMIILSNVASTLENRRPPKRFRLRNRAVHSRRKPDRPACMVSKCNRARGMQCRKNR